MSLAERLREARESAGLTLEELAERRKFRRPTYGSSRKQRPQEEASAEILLRIANALSVTLAELLGCPRSGPKKKALISQSLLEFKKRMESLGKRLSEEDLQELASMSFRGGGLVRSTSGMSFTLPWNA